MLGGGRGTGQEGGGSQSTPPPPHCTVTLGTHVSPPAVAQSSPASFKAVVYQDLHPSGPVPDIRSRCLHDSAW